MAEFITMIKSFLQRHSIIFTLIVLIFFMRILDIGCLIKLIFGIPCPGCGLTRATLAFLHLDFKTAFQYHPLFWLATPFLIFTIYGPKPLLGSKKNEITIYTVVGSLFIGVYIYRMAVLFPNIEPMTINNNSIIILLLRTIKQYLLHTN